MHMHTHNEHLNTTESVKVRKWFTPNNSFIQLAQANWVSKGGIINMGKMLVELWTGGIFDKHIRMQRVSKHYYIENFVLYTVYIFCVLLESWTLYYIVFFFVFCILLVYFYGRGKWNNRVFNMVIRVFYEHWKQ